MSSQWVFIEEKSNGLGDMIEPTIFWTKKSAHVVFRRPLEPDSDKTMNMEIGHTYHIYLQYGLFDSPDDTDQSKIKGATNGEPEELLIVPISNPVKTLLGAARLAGVVTSLVSAIIMNF